MTNAQIIFNESMKLLEAGIIGTTGRSFETVNEDGETVTIMEPEPLHTFAHWKSLGRQVKKGEHAKASFIIWKQGKAYTKKNKETGEEEEKEGRMFMKKSSFFTLDQTEPIKIKENA